MTSRTTVWKTILESCLKELENGKATLADLMNKKEQNVFDDTDFEEIVNSSKFQSYFQGFFVYLLFFSKNSKS